MTALEPYRAARRGAAFIDLSERGRLVLTGADRASYLQGLLTNDVAALGPGEGCYAAYLTPQGRMIADMAVVNLGDELLLDVDAGVAAMLLERLRELVFTEDVTVDDRTAAWAALAVHGPEAAGIVADLVRPAGDGAPPGADALGRRPEYRQWSGRFGDAPVTVVRSDEIGEVGFVLYADAAAAGPLARALAGAGAAELDAETFALLRLEAGRPAFPADMDESTIPPRGGHRGARHQRDQGLLRRPGGHRPHSPPRAGAGRPPPRRPGARRRRPAGGRHDIVRGGRARCRARGQGDHRAAGRRPSAGRSPSATSSASWPRRERSSSRRTASGASRRRHRTAVPPPARRRRRLTTGTRRSSSRRTASGASPPPSPNGRSSPLPAAAGGA